jgi:hypothetical protein
MPVSSLACPIGVIFLKVIIPRHLQLVLGHRQAPHHPVVRFTKQYRQGIQQIDIAYTNIMPDIIPDITSEL